MQLLPLTHISFNQAEGVSNLKKKKRSKKISGIYDDVNEGVRGSYLLYVAVQRHKICIQQIGLPC